MKRIIICLMVLLFVFVSCKKRKKKTSYAGEKVKKVYHRVVIKYNAYGDITHYFTHESYCRDTDSVTYMNNKLLYRE